ncbi:MAG: dihydrolipoyl dehydrogenase [Thermodesulfobacteriota bacterium]|nr:dihydrolipoyl dehydrogenase [Thermodesulfobacteriota bacterium]
MSDRPGRYDVAIIGAGTAGLTARSTVAKETDNYVVIDNGTLGTTCARVGCMPSKALIEVANAWHRQQWLEEIDVARPARVPPDGRKVMAHVRNLRDRFAGGVVKGMTQWRDHLIQKKARFVDGNTLDLGDETIVADKIIIATGSKPVRPDQWRPYEKYLIDTDSFFELPDLPQRIAVFGLGMVGIELGQALARLGVDVTGITLDKAVAGLTDPDLQAYAWHLFSGEMAMHMGRAEIIGETAGGLEVGCNGKTWVVDKVLLTLGRAPSVSNLGLENLGVTLDKNGMPAFDPATLQLQNLPVFIAGDANGMRPILHEAADEGHIAGHNAVAPDVNCFQKRISMSIAFTAPNTAVIGKSYRLLKEEEADFVVGEAEFEHQGRALMMGRNNGMIHIYGEQSNGRLLGVELILPAGEHVAHLLAWILSLEAPVKKLLSLPFYHPTLEEGLRKAIRDLISQTAEEKPAMEILRCQDTPV